MMTLIVVLGVLWLLGMIMSYTAGGFIHILLVVALIMFVVNFILLGIENLEKITQ